MSSPRSKIFCISMLSWALALGCDGLYAGRDGVPPGTLALAFAASATAAGLSRTDRVRKAIRLTLTFLAAAIFALAWACSLVFSPNLTIHAALVACVAYPLFYCLGSEIAAAASEAPPLVSLSLTTFGAGVGWIISQLLLVFDPAHYTHSEPVRSDLIVLIAALILTPVHTMLLGVRRNLQTGAQNILIGSGFGLLVVGASYRATSITDPSAILYIGLPLLFGAATLLPNRLVQRTAGRDLEVVFHVGLLISLTASCLLPLFIRIDLSTPIALLLVAFFFTVLPIFRGSFIISKRLLDASTTTTPLMQYLFGVGIGALVGLLAVAITSSANAANIIALTTYGASLLIRFRTPPAPKPTEPALKKIA